MSYDRLRLKEVRLKDFSGMSQKSFAMALGIKERTYQNYEKEVPPAKRPLVRKLILDYAKSVGKEITVWGDTNRKVTRLEDFSDLEIIQYVHKNMDRFKKLTYWRKTIEIGYLKEFREEVDKIREEAVQEALKRIDKTSV